MRTVKEARRAGAEAGGRDAEELFWGNSPEARAMTTMRWAWLASEAALRVPARFQRAFCEEYVTAADAVWGNLVWRNAEYADEVGE